MVRHESNACNCVGIKQVRFDNCFNYLVVRVRARAHIFEQIYNKTHKMTRYGINATKHLTTERWFTIGCKYAK